MMFFELRQYRIKDGKRNQWVKIMEEKIIPFQVSKGMVFVGSFVSLDEPDLYIWIRRFESQEEAERLYREVYESEFWKRDKIWSIHLTPPIYTLALSPKIG